MLIVNFLFTVFFLAAFIGGCSLVVFVVDDRKFLKNPLFLIGFLAVCVFAMAALAFAEVSSKFC